MSSKFTLFLDSNKLAVGFADLALSTLVRDQEPISAANPKL